MALEEQQDISKLVSEETSSNGNGGHVESQQPVQVFVQQPASRNWKARNTTPKEPTPAKGTLARMFPDQGEQLKVYHRRGEGPDAKVDYVGDFRLQDLKGCPGVEAFLSRHIVPKYGYGAYPCVLLDTKGNETKQDEFSIAAPLEISMPQGQGSGRAESIIAELLRDVVTKQTTPDGAPNPLQGLGQVPPPPAIPLPYQIPPHYQPVTAPNDDVKDQLLKKMIDKFDALEKSVAQANQPRQMDPGEIVERVLRGLPQPAPPPPQVDMLQIVNAMRDAIRELKPAPAPPQEDPIDRMLKFKQLFGDKNVEVELLKEMLRDQKDRNNRLEERVEQIMSSPPEDPIEKLKGMVEAVQVVKELAGETEKKDSIGAYLADMFKSAPKVFEEAGKLVDKTILRDRQTIQARQLAGQRQAQRVEAAVKKDPEKPKLEPYPEGFDVYLQRLNAAEGPGDKVKATLEAFQFIGQHEPWKKYFEACLMYAQKRDREALKYVDAFLSVLYDRRSIPEATKIEVAQLFSEHWDEILQAVLPPN